MNPELERRLRRFGATVDAAAAARDARRTTAGSEGAPVAQLDNVVAIGARPRRTVHALAVAAAVVAMAVAGGIAVALSRSGPSMSTAERQAAQTLAAVTESTEAAAAVVAIESTTATTTTLPATTSTSTSRPESSAPATRPTDPPVCRSYEDTNDYHLDICDSGAAVSLVQERLRAAVDSSLKVDGYFGPGTRAAVRTFQQMHDLAVDGQVGPATWALLVPHAPGTDTDDNGIVDPDEISTG